MIIDDPMLSTLATGCLALLMVASGLRTKRLAWRRRERRPGTWAWPPRRVRRRRAAL